MLQVTNRFHAPMMRQNTVQNRVQNQAQNTNFAGDKGEKTVRAGYGLLIFGLLGLVGTQLLDQFNKTQLLKKIEPRVSSSDYASINSNADLLSTYRRSFPLTNIAANKYLGGVIDSLEGKGGEPFTKNNLAPLVEKEKLKQLVSRINLVAQHQADSLEAAAAKIK